jgi:hypothetical protein
MLKAQEKVKEDEPNICELLYLYEQILPECVHSSVLVLQTRAQGPSDQSTEYLGHCVSDRPIAEAAI